MKKRMQKKANSTSNNKGKEQSLYSAANSGTKLSANSVLVLSFIFMGLVMLLHIWSKLRGDRQN
jgi:hypothetical protein